MPLFLVSVTLSCESYPSPGKLIAVHKDTSATLDLAAEALERIWREFVADGDPRSAGLAAYTPGKPSIVLTSAGANEVHRLITQLRSAGFSVLAPEDVQAAVIGVLEDALAPGSTWDARQAANQLVRSIREAILDWVVHIVVPYLHLQVEEIDVYGVVFKPAAACLDELDGRLAAAGIQARADQQEVPPHSSIATVTVKAGHNAFWREDSDRVMDACSLLQFMAVSVFGNPDTGFNVAPQALSLPGQMIAIAFRDGAATVSRRHPAPLVVIDGARLAYLRKRYHFELLRNLAPEKDRELCAAIAWAARGSTARTNAERLLNYVISTECLLIAKGEETTRDRWTARAMWLLRSAGSAQNRTVLKDLQDIYKYRSAIAHGRGPTVTYGQVQAAARICFEVAWRFIRAFSEGTTPEQLVAQLDDARMGL